VQGTVADEKAWVRQWIDDTYLWYQDVRNLSATTLDANRYATAIAYFDVLKSAQTTASGQPKDKFHFTYDTPTWVALSQSGQSYGYGFEFAWTKGPKTVPREATVVYTNPNTPAATVNLGRGATLQAIDGVDISDTTAAGVAVLNAGLFPEVAGSHTFVIRDLSGTSRSVTMTAGVQTSIPVQNVKTLPAPNSQVGYMLFNDHIATSEQQLVNAVTQLRDAGVTDLVLDIRYNGGGYLDIASELAYMIAGPTPTTGKVFETLNFNDKNPFQLSDAQRTTGFHSTSQGFSTASGQALPYLGLSRVYVLTGAGTCSASEAIMNGLRGVGVTVNQIGAITCGKPYGFFPQDNCNTTYFAIQFQGVNQLGFGDYADGFTPTCAVADDFAHALGDPAEARLAMALGHRASGTCTPASSVGGLAKIQSVRNAKDIVEPVLVRSALRENRFYRKSRDQ